MAGYGLERIIVFECSEVTPPAITIRIKKKAIEEQLFHIRKIYTDENNADMMTKIITKEILVQCIKNMGMSSS